jgi:hypothetical protein
LTFVNGHFSFGCPKCLACSVLIEVLENARNVYASHSSALSRNSPVLLGKNIPLQQIGIMKHHRQFGARQIGQDLLEDDLNAWRARFWVK